MKLWGLHGNGNRKLEIYKPTAIEKTFIDRCKAGRIHETSPMPWGAIATMEELDLKALYRYLQTQEPVYNKIKKIVYKLGEALPD